MLYISRRKRISTSNQYGVVDTDDNTESFVTFRELLDLIYHKNMTIVGCSKTRSRSLNIIPHQLGEFTTQYQAKLSTICGVKVVTWHGMITSVSYTGDKAWGNPIVRLSELGYSCADFIFQNCEYTDGPSLTVVLDDKVSLSEFSLRDQSSLDAFNGTGITPIDRGIVLDIRDVTDMRTVMAVYDSYPWDRDSKHFLIDDPGAILDVAGRYKQIRNSRAMGYI